jgi:hypothetical protein
MASFLPIGASADAISTFFNKIKVPRSLDDFLTSSKNDQMVIGGLASKIHLIRYLYMQIDRCKQNFVLMSNSSSMLSCQ